MKRREFITLLGGGMAMSSSLWPRGARAQQQKRLGVLMNGVATDPEAQSHLATFVQGLRKLGWIDGQTLRTEVRWSAGEANRMETYATDLVGLFGPDVLLAVTTANLIALQQATSTIPIVFTQVRDPVEQGLVPNLTHPGGNVTGFANTEFSIAGKWADLLKQMVPSIARVAVVFNPEASPQSKFYLNAVQAAAPSLGLNVMTAPIQSMAEIEPTLARLSREPNLGLIWLPDNSSLSRTKLIAATVAHYRLPAIHGSRDYVSEGGLMHYGNDLSEQFRQAPYYIDRILKGAKPGDLPVQLPTRFKFIVNRKTASALGIEVPLGILLAADEVIE
jgi:putative tryptophan/tyrosine transport system substrate-binding protein